MCICYYQTRRWIHRKSEKKHPILDWLSSSVITIHNLMIKINTLTVRWFFLLESYICWNNKSRSTSTPIPFIYILCLSFHVSYYVHSKWLSTIERNTLKRWAYSKWYDCFSTAKLAEDLKNIRIPAQCYATTFHFPLGKQTFKLF